MEADEGCEIIVAVIIGLLLAWRLAKLDSEWRRVSIMALEAPEATGIPSTLEWDRAWLIPWPPGRWNNAVPSLGFGGKTVGFGPIFRVGSTTYRPTPDSLLLVAVVDVTAVATVVIASMAGGTVTTVVLFKVDNTGTGIGDAEGVTGRFNGAGTVGWLDSSLQGLQTSWRRTSWYATSNAWPNVRITSVAKSLNIKWQSQKDTMSIHELAGNKNQ